MIDGVTIRRLARIPDDRGIVFHMLKRTDPEFTAFGEVYFTSLYPGVIKAWHLHQRVDLNYACIAGNVKVVLYDGREASRTRGNLDEYVIGEHDYSLLHIPCGVTNGMQGLGGPLSVVANCATQPHDPSEMVRFRLDEVSFEYDWSRRPR